MRNPFRKKQVLPGASAEWDESQHIDAGDGYVAIPEDQLPAETLERLKGIDLRPLPDGGGVGVFINMDAVEAEVEAETDRYAQELADRDRALNRSLIDEIIAAEDEPLDDDRMRETVARAFNNRDNWLQGPFPDDDTRFVLMRIDLLTGRIADPE